MQTEVGLTDYDDFLEPDTPVRPDEDADGEYTMLDRVTGLSNGNDFVLTAYVLPAKMKLGIRMKFNGTPIYTMYNGKIVVSNGGSSGENATGIISTDVQGEEFYFRRNHKYVFTGGKTNDLLQNHAMD